MIAVHDVARVPAIREAGMGGRRVALIDEALGGGSMRSALADLGFDVSWFGSLGELLSVAPPAMPVVLNAEGASRWPASVIKDAIDYLPLEYALLVVMAEDPAGFGHRRALTNRRNTVHLRHPVSPSQLNVAIGYLEMHMTGSSDTAESGLAMPTMRQ